MNKTNTDAARLLSLAHPTDAARRLARIMYGRRLLTSLAKELGAGAAFDLEHLPNGSVGLHTEGTYLVLPTFGNNLYFRRVKNRRDYTGGVNNWLPMETLKDIRETAKIIHTSVN